MTASASGIRALAGELVGVLDEEIALLVLRRSQLEALADAFVKRDDGVLERLLDEMERTRQLQADTDEKLRGIRGEFAAALGRDPAEVKLAGVIEHLPRDLRTEVAGRRHKVVDLVREVRRGHLQASMQLLECMRINGMLLDGLFGHRSSVTTYDARGADPWRDGAGLVDAEL